MGASGWEDLIWQREAGPNWSVERRLLAAYLVSGPSSNRIGCSAFETEVAAHVTGIPAARIPDVLDELERDGFVRHDRSQGWVWIPAVLLHLPFRNEEEVRKALPELAVVPRGLGFHADLIRAFRASADRPGVPVVQDPSWLGGIIGDTRAADLAQRLEQMNDMLRRHLPGLPSLNKTGLNAAAQVLINLRDYSKRWREYLADIVNTRPLRILGLITISAAILFVVFPGIDLGVAGWFFVPPRNFTLGDTWIGRFFDNEIHFAMEWFLVILVGAFLYGLYRSRPVWRLTPKHFLFVALSIALGAGLLTNVLLKDSWGRARPSQVAEFGGTKQFTPAFVRSTQCEKNCSFVSGDASLAASFMSFAIIADRNRRRWWLGLGGFTALVGLMRMARGSHFLSDVFFAVVFTLMVVFALARLILEERWRNWPRWRDRGQAAEAQSLRGTIT
ncbi:MAG TPA: phosphatase PAP2 family protein [Alphaproteobacteria bacterium]|nr:phosphatase PAP2 family protein [Alphaproteobacteria bacterium]